MLGPPVLLPRDGVSVVQVPQIQVPDVGEVPKVAEAPEVEAPVVDLPVVLDEVSVGEDRVDEVVTSSVPVVADVSAKVEVPEEVEARVVN